MYRLFTTLDHRVRWSRHLIHTNAFVWRVELSAVNVRTATIGDIEDVQRVAAASWHAAHDAIVGEDAVDEFLDDYYDVGSLAGRVADAGIIFYVAEDQRVVGFATARPYHAEQSHQGETESDGESKSVGETESASEVTTFSLQSLYVHPDHWGTGVGSRLLERIEDEASTGGGGRLRLIVMADNERAIGFYEALGFERVADHYDERLDVWGYAYAKEL
jgi:ribosomal protein S18 acetylase RimI-like enzyme